MTKDIHFSYAKAVTAEAVAAYKEQVALAQDQLVHGTGKGNDFLGWMNLPADIRPQSVSYTHLTLPTNVNV